MRAKGTIHLIFTMFLFYPQPDSTVAAPGGKLLVVLRNFSNPSNLDMNGKCCESPCMPCDYYLQVCLKETAGGSCVKSIVTKTYYNTKVIAFKENEDFSIGGQNPLTWKFNSWKVIGYISSSLSHNGSFPHMTHAEMINSLLGLRSSVFVDTSIQLRGSNMKPK